MQNELMSGFKYSRVLTIYTRLMDGEVINKNMLAEQFCVAPRSIQRDIEDLRTFFADRADAGDIAKELVYDQKLNGYYLRTKDDSTLTNSEILAVCKILLESRAFCKSDITPILDKLLNSCVPKSKQRMVRELISNEMLHYVEPRHGRHFIENLWDIGEAVNGHKVMKISYTKAGGATVERKIQPVGIMFSEFYFYLTAFIDGIDKKAEFSNPDDIFLTIYRIDRIEDFDITGETFNIPYRDRFEEGEFRKRIQFMYGGRLRRIKFIYKGRNVDAILDRLPTAKIIEHNDGGYIITAEVFGDGVDMWIRSQGEFVEVVV